MPVKFHVQYGHISASYLRIGTCCSRGYVYEISEIYGS